MAIRPTGARRDRRPRNARAIRRTFETLFARYGPQQWWPGETPFEVMVGAILTQNAAWTNVEKAIARLKAAGALSPGRMLALPRGRLASLIRPSGYFNVKERRLRAFLEFFRDRYGASVARMRRRPAGELREELLAVNGIGRETADSILLYALDKPVFVIDAYTRRIMARHGTARGDEDYDALRAAVERALGGTGGSDTLRAYNEFHALLVRVGKEHCKPDPRCDSCTLRGFRAGRRGGAR